MTVEIEKKDGQKIKYTNVWSIDHEHHDFITLYIECYDIDGDEQLNVKDIASIKILQI